MNPKVEKKPMPTMLNDVAFQLIDIRIGANHDFLINRLRRDYYYLSPVKVLQRSGGSHHDVFTRLFKSLITVKAYPELRNVEC